MLVEVGVPLRSGAVSEFYSPSRLGNNPLVTIQSVPIKIGIIVTLMFHSFKSSTAFNVLRSKVCLFFLFL